MSNYLGKKFNRLSVVGIDHVLRYTQGNGRRQNIIFFKCLCDCGEVAVIRQPVLKKQLSCGCAKTEENKSRTLDITGNTYTRLTVISKAVGGDWECVCICGNFVFVPVDRLQSGNTKSCGCLQKEHASTSMTKILRDYRESVGSSPDTPLSSDYKIQRAAFLQLAKEVYTRDSHTCAWCSATHCKVNAHHIETWATSPEKRFDRGNLVTLCEPCHKSVHSGNYHTRPDEIMSILLRGYVKVIEDKAFAARVELTSN